MTLFPSSLVKCSDSNSSFFVLSSHPQHKTSETKNLKSLCQSIICTRTALLLAWTWKYETWVRLKFTLATLCPPPIDIELYLWYTFIEKSRKINTKVIVVTPSVWLEPFEHKTSNQRVNLAKDIKRTSKNWQSAVKTQNTK